MCVPHPGYLYFFSVAYLCNLSWRGAALPSALARSRSDLRVNVVNLVVFFPLLSSVGGNVSQRTAVGTDGIKIFFSSSKFCQVCTCFLEADLPFLSKTKVYII